MASGPSPEVAVHAVRITAPARRELWAAVAKTWPNEVVMLLGGHHTGSTAHIECCVELAAAATSPDHFCVPAADFVGMEATLRKRGQQWLGFAHSHPDGDAALSTVDRAELWRGCLQLVVSTHGPEPIAAAAFWLSDAQLLHLPLQFAAEESA